MPLPPAGWYPDPTDGPRPRFWDGHRWTDPVPAATTSTETLQARRRHARRLGWIGLGLCLLATLAVVVPSVDYVIASSKTSVTLGEGATSVLLPSDTTYGIYIDDVDNDGYSHAPCSVSELGGQEIAESDFSPGRITTSDTETLDMAFNTGSGRLSIDCAILGERVRVGPAPAQRPIVLGVGLAVILGTFAVASLIGWVTQRPGHMRLPDEHA